MLDHSTIRHNRRIPFLNDLQSKATTDVVTDRWPVEFRYISNRLVLQIVQQDQATRSRWNLTSVSTPWGGLGFQRNQVSERNELALCKQATKAVKDHTTTIAQGWGDYVRADFDLTMGTMTVLMGWVDRGHVPIAVMKSEVDDPEVGRVLVALFGSASNYRHIRPGSDRGEIPSDVDGLYGILDRTREPRDPKIDDHYLDRDIGQSPAGRADTAIRLLDQRFKGFREDRFDVLMKRFCTVEEIGGYDLVILGAPVWIATPLPQKRKHSHRARLS